LRAIRPAAYGRRVSNRRTRRRRLDDELDSPVRGAPLSPVLQLQQMAGNRAVTSLMRKPKVKDRRKKDTEPKKDEAPKVSDKQANDDLAFALKYVDDFYEGVRDVLELKDKVRENAIKNYVEFGKLTDPPTLADAIFGALVSSLVGLIPGGAVIKAGLTAGIFALDMRGLQKDLKVMPIPGVSAEEERAKGPTAQHTGKSEKLYERGKTGYDVGKDVVGAIKDTKKKQQEAAEAEAAAKEIAGLSSGRVTDWAKAIKDARVQEDKVVAWLKGAIAEGKRGGLEAAVRARLGPIPDVGDGKFQKELEKEYEMALYREKYKDAKWVTTYSTDEYTTYKSSGMRGGPALSKATRRRIAELDGHPFMWEYDAMIATILQLKHEDRHVRLDSSGHLKGGMKF
jgi:hypothetical protein